MVRGTGKLSPYPGAVRGAQVQGGAGVCLESSN